MERWFIGDTHLGHANIIPHTRRPFPDSREMDEAIIHNWNEVVSEGDEVWHLGDFAYRCPTPRVRSYIERMKGNIHLILGNHDGKRTMEDGFSSIQHYKELYDLPGFKKGRVVLFHYPIQSWNGRFRGSIHLHGHSHGGSAYLPMRMDVSVECLDFKPINADDIILKMRKISEEMGYKKPDAKVE